MDGDDLLQGEAKNHRPGKGADRTPSPPAVAPTAELGDKPCQGTPHQRISKTTPPINGGMAEWSIAAVLKTAVPQGTGGSNPSPSASTRLRLDFLRATARVAVRLSRNRDLKILYFTFTHPGTSAPLDLLRAGRGATAPKVSLLEFSDRLLHLLLLPDEGFGRNRPPLDPSLRIAVAGRADMGNHILDR